MLSVLTVTMVIIMTVLGWNVDAAGALPNLVHKWEKLIENNAPSKTLEEYQENPELSDKDRMLLGKKAEYIMLQEKHRMLLLIAIVVSTPVLLTLVLFFWKKAPDCCGDSLVHAIGLVLVIEGTMFIAVSAVTTEQLTAPIGILGAIAGYLFGSAKRRAIEKTGTSSTA